MENASELGGSQGVKPRRYKPKKKRKKLNEVYNVGDCRPTPLEKVGQEALRKYMEDRGWLVEKVHGSITMKGWPDLYCHHPVFGQRWVECKRHGKKGKLQDSQVAKFKKWAKFKIGVWVLCSPSDYDLLFDPPNWHKFLSLFR